MGLHIDNQQGIITWNDQFVLLSGKPYTCPSAVSVGDAVFISGSDAVDRADASSNSTSPAFAIVRAKPTATTCLIQSSGEVDAFGGLTAGATYYLSDSTPGGITLTAPTSGSFQQALGFARNATTLVVIIDPRDVLTQA